MLDALEAISTHDLLLQIVVVDNHSNDGVLPSFSNDHSTVTFIPSAVNGGFAYGCNLGASHATADLLLFLNPDTVPSSNALVELCQWYRAHSAAIVSCRQSESPLQDPLLFPRLATVTGIQRSIWRMMHRRSVAHKGCIDGVAQPDWVSGSVVLISRSWFDRIGGWDERYWMYSEDVDLCKRITDVGGAVVVLCDVYLRHVHGGTTRVSIATEALTKSEVIASKHVYIQRHFPRSQRLAAHVLLCFATLASRLLAAIVSLPLIMIKRLRVQPLLLWNILAYYTAAAARGTWISKRSVVTP